MRRFTSILMLLICHTARAREPKVGTPILVLNSGGHTSVVWKMLFTSDGKQLISVSNDKTIRFWDVASGETTRVLRPPIGSGRQGKVYAAVLTPDEQTLVVAGLALDQALGSIYVISLTSGQIKKVLAGGLDPIMDLAITKRPDGRVVLASGVDGTAKIWDVESGQFLMELEADQAFSTSSIAFAPDGKLLAIASYENTVRVWSTATGKCEHTITARSGVVADVAWNADGTMLATGGYDRSIKLWTPDGKPVASLNDLEAEVNSVAFTPDSRELLYGWGSKSEGKFGTAVVSVPSGKERVRFRKHESAVGSVTVSPDGTMAATAATESSEICLWKIADASLLHRLAGAGKRKCSAGWSPDSKSIAWGDTYAFQSLNHRGPLERSFSLSDLELRSLSNEKYQRSCESRGPLSLSLLPATREAPTTLQLSQNNAVLSFVHPRFSWEQFYSFSFVGDDRFVAGGDFGLYPVNPQPGLVVPVTEFRGHTGSVLALAWSPDQKFLLSASADQTMEIWNLKENALLMSLFVADDDWIAWVPDGYYAASHGGESLMGWQVPTDSHTMGHFTPASQFHKSLFRPDVIKLALETGSVATALLVLREATKHVLNVLPPRVAIIKPETNGTRLDKPEMEVRALAWPQGEHPVTAFSFLVDNRAYDDGVAGRKVASPLDLANDSRQTVSWTVRLDPGKHRLAVIAETAVSYGTSAPIDVVYEESKAKRPRLFVVAVGVSEYPGRLRLQYAASDANALETVLKEKSTPLFESIETRVLTDKKATRTKIIHELKWMRENMRSSDVGIFFFSGHGTSDRNTFFFGVL